MSFIERCPFILSIPYRRFHCDTQRTTVVEPLCLTYCRRVYCIDLVGDVKVVLNEGMPHLRNPFDKGRLIIPFTVSITYYVWGGFKWS